MSAWRRPQALVLLLVCVLLAASLTAPTLRLQQPTFRYVFVFDITQSMNVADVVPDDPAVTRLEYAKEMALAALSGLACGSEVGLALFTGHRAFLLITPIELCDNYRELSSMVKHIDWRMTWESRSEVAKGLYKSIALLKQLAGQTRLVFLTDGHEAPPINPALPPRFPQQKNDILGLIVGVGGDQPVPIPKLDEDGLLTGYWQADEVMHTDSFSYAENSRSGTPAVIGTEHLSSLREDYLQGLADKTGLGYLRLSGPQALIAELQNARLGELKVLDTDIRWLFALAALVLMLGLLLLAPWTARRAEARKAAA